MYKKIRTILLISVAIVFPLVSFAAWVDAPAAPPGYGTLDQNTFKPLNLSDARQAKVGALGIGAPLSATFPVQAAGIKLHVAGDIKANSFIDDYIAPDGSSPYFIDPGGANSNLAGSLTVGGALTSQGRAVCLNNGTGCPTVTSAWNTSGSNIYNTNTGNVGIGTTAPTSKLSVMDINNSVAGQRIELGSGPTTLYTFGRNPVTGFLDFSGNQVGFVGYTFSGGNVGIGTTSPGAKLDVGGRIAVGEGGTGNNQYSYITMRDDESSNGITNTGVKYIHANSNLIGFLGSAADWLTRWDDAGNQINTGGVIEAGSSGGNHYSYLDLRGDDTYTDYGLRLLRGNTGANAWSEITHRGTGDFIINANEVASLKFRTQSTDRMTIDSAGNVSIGTTAVNARLTAYAPGGTNAIYGYTTGSGYGVSGEGGAIGVRGLGGIGVAGDAVPSGIGGRFRTNGSTSYNLQLPARDNGAAGVYLYVSTTGCPVNSALAIYSGVFIYPSASRICVVNY